MLILSLCLWSAPAQALANPDRGSQDVQLYSRRILGHRVAVVAINLKAHVVIRPLLTRSGPGDIDQLLGSHPPLAALTGTFFDTRTGSVVGSVAFQGRLLEEGAVGNSLVIDHQRHAFMLDTARKLGRYVDWSDFDFGIASGPTLVRDGRLVVHPFLEGFHDPSLFGARRRTALGVTANHRLLMVASNSPMCVHTLARIMQSLGAVQAVNMDGGTSSALYYRGRLVIAPGRRLTNLVAVYPANAVPALHTPWPEEAQACYQRGQELLSRGQCLQARSQLAKAVALAPSESRYRRSLGDAYVSLHQVHPAADQYARAARLELEAGQASQALWLAGRAAHLEPGRPELRLLARRAALKAGVSEVARKPGPPPSAAHLAAPKLATVAGPADQGPGPWALVSVLTALTLLWPWRRLASA